MVLPKAGSPTRGLHSFCRPGLDPAKRRRSPSFMGAYPWSYAGEDDKADCMYHAIAGSRPGLQKLSPACRNLTALADSLKSRAWFELVSFWLLFPRGCCPVVPKLLIMTRWCDFTWHRLRRGNQNSVGTRTTMGCMRATTILKSNTPILVRGLSLCSQVPPQRRSIAVRPRRCRQDFPRIWLRPFGIAVRLQEPPIIDNVLTRLCQNTCNKLKHATSQVSRGKTRRAEAWIARNLDMFIEASYYDLNRSCKNLYHIIQEELQSICTEK